MGGFESGELNLGWLGLVGFDGSIGGEISDLAFGCEEVGLLPVMFSTGGKLVDLDFGLRDAFELVAGSKEFGLLSIIFPTRDL